MPVLCRCQSFLAWALCRLFLRRSEGVIAKELVDHCKQHNDPHANPALREEVLLLVELVQKHSSSNCRTRRRPPGWARGSVGEKTR